MNKVIWSIVAVVFGFAVYKIDELCTPPDLPVLTLDEYWGPGAAAPDDKLIRPFQINFKVEMIQDLKDRLANHRSFQAPLKGVGFEYGFNTNYLSKVVSFWKDQYDFKARETFLNQYPQFLTKVQGLDIHFLHVKPAKSNPQIRVVPLLLLHGWPGSVREFYEILPLLTTPQPGKHFVFEVIAPSLPGFGFSQAAFKPGLGAAEVSVVLRNLMLKLGFNKFVIQGGDWGSIIGSNLATLFPGEVIGYHTNMPFVQTPLSGIKTILGSFFPSLVVDEGYADRMYPLSKKMSFLIEETGYFHIQASKPDTVGVGLNDSPAGLAAYILEKFTTWTNFGNKFAQDGNLTQRFKLVDLVDNLMFYWASGSITTPMRLYAETFNKRTQGLGLDRIPTTVPTAAIFFKYEFSLQPMSFLKEKYPNILQYTVVNHTGHFAALENPKALADDLFEATVEFLKFTVAK